MKALVAFLVVALSFFSAVAPVPPPAKPSLARRERMAIYSAVAQEMRQQHVVGLSLGIIKNGHVVLTKGYGRTNVELGVLASPRSV